MLFMIGRGRSFPGVVVVILFVAAPLLLFSEDPHENKPGAGVRRAPRAPEAVEQGRVLFAKSCSGCHGPLGEGGRGPKLNDGDLVRSATDDRLFSSIKNGKGGMPPFPLPENEILEMIGFIRSLSAPAAEAHARGDAAAGRTLFYGKAGCGGCHRIRGEGGFLGPDLSNIGALRSYRQLREAVVKPQFAVDGDYRAARAVLRSGKTLDGVLRNATNYAFELQTADGEVHPLAAEDLREIVYRKAPLMPAGYDKKLSPAELDNVLAFVASQTSRPIVHDEEKGEAH